MMVETGCVYTEDWFLDAVAPGGWDRVSVVWDRAVVADLSFIVRRRLGLTFIELPPLCRTGSPRLALPSGKAVTRQVAMLDLAPELLAKLPRADRLELRLSPGCPTVQGFVHARCAVTHTFTYRSPPGYTPEQFLDGAHKKTRNLITQALKQRAIERSSDPERFLRLHGAEFGATSTIDRAAIRRTLEAALSLDRGAIVIAREPGGDDVAGLALIWDGAFVYCWMRARDPSRATAGDNSLLIFEAMREAATRGLRLDLDGYGSFASGVFLMKFGLDPAVRPAINRSSRTWKLFHAVSSALRKEREESAYRV